MCTVAPGTLILRDYLKLCFVVCFSFLFLTLPRWNACFRVHLEIQVDSLSSTDTEQILSFWESCWGMTLCGKKLFLLCCYILSLLWALLVGEALQGWLGCEYWSVQVSCRINDLGLQGTCLWILISICTGVVGQLLVSTERGSLNLTMCGMCPLGLCFVGSEVRACPEK